MICTLFSQSKLTVNIQTEVASFYKDRQMLTSCGFRITSSVNDMRYLLQKRSFRPVLLKYTANLHKRMVQLKSRPSLWMRDASGQNNVLQVNDTCFLKLVYKFILAGRRNVGQPRKRWEEANTHINEKKAQK